MAILKRNELLQMDNKALLNKKIVLNRELIKVNSQVATGTPPENPGRVREIKKTVARINTLLSKRKLKGGGE